MKNPHATKSRSFSSNRNVITFIIFITFLLLAIMLSYAQSNQRGADDIVNIPDVNLKAALLAIPELNSIDDGEITQSEASSFAGALNLGDLGITDPTGLEFFSSLTELNLRNNTLGSIDVGTNVSLIVLNLRNTGLTTIDVANLTQLTYLELELNDLTSLDISNNTALTDLLLQGNNLTSIDLSQNAALRSVRLHVNPLTSVDFSNNPNITSIILNQTNLTSLDVSNQPNLSYLSLRETQLTSIDLSSNLNLDNLNLQSNTVMTALDLSANANLRILSLLNSTGFQTVNLKNGNNENLESINFNGTSSLTCIAVDDVAYSAANWTFVHENNEFKAYCDPNDPVHIPDANFKAALVGDNSINTNEDEEVSYGEAEVFTGTISVDNLGITDATGIEAFPNIYALQIRQNSLTELNVSANTAMEILRCDRNALTSLDLTSNLNIYTVAAFNNQLSEVQFPTENSALRHIEVQGNNLNVIDVTNLPLLDALFISGNEISDLDISNNLLLERLVVDNNNLTEIDLSNHPEVYVVYAPNNDLQSLNIQNGANEIVTSFDITGNPNLTCVVVDDPGYSRANWDNVDAQTQFRVDCDPAAFIDFPDTNFKAALVAHDPVIDMNSDGEISYGEAEAFDGSMNVDAMSISDFTGLEFFINLTELRATANTATSIDVSSNTELTGLFVYNVPLAALDVSNNVKLTGLQFGGNSTFTTIDVSNNTELKSFSCPNTSAFTEIIGIENLTKVDYFYIQGCSIESLDLRNCSDMNQLRASRNNLTYLDVRNGMNEMINLFEIDNNPELSCVAVDNPAYSNQNWTIKDAEAEYKATCDPNEPVHIPDENFKSRLLGIGSLNTNDDDEISYGEAANYGLSINVNDAGIEDLTGLEAFTNLIGFSAKNNSISEIDLSNNTELGTLVLDNNSLTSLDVSNNTKLTHLQVFSNALTSIDVSMLPELRKLWVKDNQLTSLNTSSNLLLNDLECGENQITSLDLSNNTALTTIQTHENNLTVLDVSNNPNLFRITAFYNDISSIDLSNNTALTSVNFEFNNLSEIDVSMLPILTSFKVRGNGENLVSVNLKNGNNSNFTGAVLLDQNPNLICIQVDDPAFSEANWTFVDEQTSFSTDCNVVEFADANFESALLSDNSINTDGDDFIQVSEATVLTVLDVSGKEISDLTGIQAFVNLTELYCDNNTLTSLDVSANTSLIKLYAYTNSLTSVALGQNTALVELLIDHNALTSLDVSNNTGLTRLRAGFNTLGGIDVSSNVNLNNLSIRSAGLTSLDISNNVSLTYLEMSTNELTSLDLSANILLENIFLNENQITTLDVSSNTSLLELEVGDNALESLNAANGNNQAITYFYTINNPNLGCITVDDPAYSETNWSNDVDDTVVFSTDCSNDATDIVTFSVDGMVGTATIDASNHTIEATVNSSVNLSAMEPTITISDGATISPVGPQDFTSSVTYTVAAEDNSTTQDWVVTLNVLPLSSKAISDVRVYPNPTRDVISIEGISDDFTWQILTISGKMLDKGKRQKTVDLSYYKSGLYIVQIQSQNGLNQTIRITKTN